MAFPFQSVGLQGPPSGPNPRKSRPRRNRARWFWPTLRQRAPARPLHDRLVFDPLEPRLLLNADVLAINLAHDLGPQAGDQRHRADGAGDRAGRRADSSVQRVQVFDQSNNAVLASATSTRFQAVAIVGDARNDNLPIDATSFAGRFAPAISSVAAARTTSSSDNASAQLVADRPRCRHRQRQRRHGFFVQNVGNLTARPTTTIP